MIKLSPAAQNLEPSATIAAAAKARELKSQGVKVYDFTLGEPDFKTPEHICDAARKAIADGQTHYTPAAGIPALKQAVCRYYAEEHGLAYEPAQVVVSNGAKHSIHNALTVLCGPGDEVIIPAPYWVSYSELVKLTGAKPVVIPTREQDGFKLTPDQLREHLNPSSRLLMLNSPCNPTGTTYTSKQLAALAEVAVEHDLLVMSDEIYEKLVYASSPSEGGAGGTPPKVHSFASLREGLAERTILISGVSKSYAMTGWRIGWAIAPQPAAKSMADLQSQETSNPCSISQYAAVAALEGSQECVEEMRQQFAKRRKFVLARLRTWPEVTFPEPDGAFYAFFNVSRHFGRTLGGVKVTNSNEFCTAALQAAHVALVTGSAFGAEGYVRLSFAADLADLEVGLDRLETLLRG
jgi:aspartate aminotransferase